MLVAAAAATASATAANAVVDAAEGKNPLPRSRDLIFPGLVTAGLPLGATGLLPLLGPALLALPVAEGEKYRQRQKLISWLVSHEMIPMCLPGRPSWVFAFVHKDELGRLKRTRGEDPAQLAAFAARYELLAPLFRQAPHLAQHLGLKVSPKGVLHLDPEATLDGVSRWGNMVGALPE